MIPVWPMLDRNSGMPSWIRIEPKMRTAYVTKIPTAHVGAGSVPLHGLAALRQRRALGSIVLLTAVVLLVWWRRR